jgi:hypothetical protein
VQCCNLCWLADPAWAAYERNGDKDALATSQARTFRANYAPALAGALTGPRHGAFGDRLESGLNRRLANHPTRVNSFVQTIVLAKQVSASLRPPAEDQGDWESWKGGLA